MKHRELCKKLRFDHTTKLLTHKPESVLVNKTRKIIWNFKIQSDHSQKTIPSFYEEEIKNVSYSGVYGSGKLTD